MVGVTGVDGELMGVSLQNTSIVCLMGLLKKVGLLLCNFVASESFNYKGEYSILLRDLYWNLWSLSLNSIDRSIYV